MSAAWLRDIIPHSHITLPSHMQQKQQQLHSSSSYKSKSSGYNSSKVHIGLSRQGLCRMCLQHIDSCRQPAACAPPLQTRNNLCAKKLQTSILRPIPVHFYPAPAIVTPPLLFSLRHCPGPCRISHRCTSQSAVDGNICPHIGPNVFISSHAATSPPTNPSVKASKLSNHPH